MGYKEKIVIKKAMIMAAGVGSRLDPLTQSSPKPLVPVANVPVLELILKHLKKYGITDVIANTHFMADPIHKKYSNNDLGVILIMFMKNLSLVLLEELKSVNFSLKALSKE
jgi:NDP-sugar pyrophosphorylase family protein